MNNKLNFENELFRLQEVISHQSEQIERLSDELYTQQKEIAQLKKVVSNLKADMDAQKDRGDLELNVEQEKPPHY